ncbi:sodium-coupled monocarboxylate transporter 1-like [Rhipicephalus microplus]|uniref:sodium-coupled monocarboxylate transporter 1-like n=1 Tax=Rhipicephalus microplus TaxID=6941 RepID=UPI003F6C1AAA
MVIVAKVMWDAKSGDTRIQPLSEILTYKYFYNYSFDLTTDETIWAGLLATTPTFFNRICLDQGTAQRYFASRNQKEAKWTVIAGTLMTCVFYGLLACAGAALVCRYRGCDPVLSGSIKKFDQLLPFYLLEDLASFPGLSGIFIAGVVSASISTLSSLVNSQAAVWYFDVITPFCKVRDTQVDLIVKALAFAVGGVMTGCSMVVPYLGSVTVMFMAVNSAITGPFVGLVLLGLTVPFANSKGAGATALLMVVYQLLHMSVRINSGAQAQRMPVTLEFCPGNVTTKPSIVNVTLPAFSKRSVNAFPLFHLSSYWSSLFSTVATYIGGIALSLLLGTYLLVLDLRVPSSRETSFIN